MIEEKGSQVQIVPWAEKEQTKANQVWHQLNLEQQQKPLQSIIQICLQMSNRMAKRREVVHEPHD